MKNNLSKYPWDAERGQLVYDPRYYPWRDAEIDWRDNFVFAETMHLTSFRWPHGVNLVDSQGLIYNMFNADFEAYVLDGLTIVGSYLVGDWTFIKRGQKYGVCEANVLGRI